MNKTILKINHLNIQYNNSSQKILTNLTLDIKQGECVGLIGESGSGKSTTALSIMGLLNQNATVQGNIFFHNIDLLTLNEKDRDTYRWKKIAIVFQNSLDVLNPVLTIKEQMEEVLYRHITSNKEQIKNKVEYYFGLVKLEKKWLNSYPHQLSGGMRQKVLIAMALICEPELLLVDEPTMALDSIAKYEIVQLLLQLQKEKQFSMLVISHEMPVIASLTSKLAVMYRGHIMEAGTTKEMLANPYHPYTRGLIYSSPSLNPFRDMWGIMGEITSRLEFGCPYYNRCNQTSDICLHTHPTLTPHPSGRQISCVRGGILTIVRGNRLSKTYQIKGQTIHACKQCTIEIHAGEVCTIIGQSGSGKTTIAELLAGILQPDSGNIIFENELQNKNLKTSEENGIQIIFQDPFSSINEHLTIQSIISEPLDIKKIGTKEERLQRIKEALHFVQLPTDTDFLHRKGSSLSGGQRQRLAIARAIVMKPKLLIADEISAMLDPSTAANILRLLKELQNKEGFAMLYITHDLPLAKKISDTIYIMKQGEIIEHGPAQQIFRFPQKSYTKQLLQNSEQLFFEEI